MLPLACTPVSLTHAIADGHFLADPSAVEESISAHAVTIVVDQDGTLLSVTKVGGATMTDEAIGSCMRRAHIRGKELLEKLALQDNGDPARSA